MFLDEGDRIEIVPQGSGVRITFSRGRQIIYANTTNNLDFDIEASLHQLFMIIKADQDKQKYGWTALGAIWIKEEERK